MNTPSFTRAGGGMLLLMCALGLLLKSPDALGLPQFWAEDGAVFFREQWAQGWPRLFSPYAGYLHLIPRGVAWVASWFPARLAPAMFNTAAIAIDALCIAFLLLRLQASRMAIIAFIGIFLTPTNGEIFGTLTNVQWFTQLALLVACFLPPATTTASTARRCWSAALILACALTGPFSTLLALLYLALSVGVAVCRHLRWNSWIVEYHARLDHRLLLPLLCLGGLVQALVSVSVKSGQLTEPSLANAVHAIAFAQAHLFGNVLVSNLLFLPALALVVAVVATTRLSAAWKGFLAIALAFSLMQILAASGKFTLIGPELGVGDRYYFLFKIVFWLLLATAATACMQSRAQAMQMVLGLAVLVAAVNTGKLQRAPLADKDWQRYARGIDRGEETVVEINPSWNFTIPGKQGSGEPRQ